MKIHHLDCCTMCPLGARRFINNEGLLVAHCLLIETDAHGLVLVDAGISTADMSDPRHRLGAGFAIGLRPTRDTRRSALRRVEALGFSPRDVRNIVLTHLDVDHAGGIADFPWATIHVHVDEHVAAIQRATANERRRYRPVQWGHGPAWRTFETAATEPWFGFAAARQLPGLPDSIVTLPLPGHTRGHAAVAVANADRWLVHAGDAYFHRSAIATPAVETPSGIRFFERNVAIDYAKVLDNHARLTELAASHPDVDVFCAHDPHEFVRSGGIIER